jgi:hypothetical protein
VIDPLPGIKEPSIRRIFGVLGFLAALPVVFLLLAVPGRIALPILGVAVTAGTLYGCYWMMRIIHIDRAWRISRVPAVWRYATSAVGPAAICWSAYYCWTVPGKFQNS